MLQNICIAKILSLSVFYEILLFNVFYGNTVVQCLPQNICISKILLPDVFHKIYVLQKYCCSVSFMKYICYKNIIIQYLCDICCEMYVKKCMLQNICFVKILQPSVFYEIYMSQKYFCPISL